MQLTFFWKSLYCFTKYISEKFAIKNKPLSKNAGKPLIILTACNFNENTALPKSIF